MLPLRGVKLMPIVRASGLCAAAFRERAARDRAGYAGQSDYLLFPHETPLNLHLEGSWRFNFVRIPLV